MEEGFRLPARFQPQVWIKDVANSVGESTGFDAQEALLAQRAPVFRRIAQEILRGGHDYDELAIDAGVTGDWLKPESDRTLHVDVDEDDFRAWLEAAGLSEEEAFSMEEDRLSVLRDRLQGAAQPRP